MNDRKFKTITVTLEIPVCQSHDLAMFLLAPSYPNDPELDAIGRKNSDMVTEKIKEFRNQEGSG